MGGDFIFVYLSVPDSQGKYPALDSRQPAVGFARHTPVRGSVFCSYVAETQEKLGEETPKVDTRIPLLYPLDSTSAVPLQEGAQPEASEV